MGMKDLSQEDVMGLLDTCYTKCLDGIPKVSPRIEDMANDYLIKYDSTEDACKAMLKNQITKMYNFRGCDRIWWCYHNAINFACKCRKCHVCSNENDCLHSLYGRV